MVTSSHQEERIFSFLFFFVALTCSTYAFKDRLCDLPGIAKHPNSVQEQQPEAICLDLFNLKFSPLLIGCKINRC